MAKEITSETFFRFINKYGDKDMGEDEKTKLLQTIAKNITYDYFRKNKVREEYSSQLSRRNEFSSIDYIFDRLSIEEIKKVVSSRKAHFTIPELLIFEMLFEDFYLHDKPAELSKDSGLSIDVVTNSKRQLFKKLRKMFKNETMISV